MALKGVISVENHIYLANKDIKVNKIHFFRGIKIDLSCSDIYWYIMANFIFLPIPIQIDDKNNNRKTCHECGAILIIEQVCHKFNCSYAIKCDECNCRLDLTRHNVSHIHIKECLHCGFNFESYLMHKFDCPIIRHCQCLVPINMDKLKCYCSYPNSKIDFFNHK